MAAGLLSGRACLLSGTELRCWACRARLGNSADVSKGLRQLYASGVIARTGQGGRHGPFQYHARCLLPVCWSPHHCLDIWVGIRIETLLKSAASQRRLIGDVGVLGTRSGPLRQQHLLCLHVHSHTC